jgi:surface protein
MGTMFYGCAKLETLDIRNFDMTNVNYLWGFLGGCTALTELRLDNCNYHTINIIISDSGFPTGVSDSGNPRYIYCQQANASGLTAPDGWSFRYV